MVSYLLPMFPLGRPVLPGEVLGLRVFEPRYVALLDNIAQRPQPEFGTVMIDRGSEVGGGDVRRSVGTVVVAARIQPLDDGHFAVAAIGNRRMRVVEWLHDDPHPWAMVQDWPESRLIPDEDGEERFERIFVRTNLMIQASGAHLIPAQDMTGRPLSQRLYAVAHRLGAGAADLQDLLESDDMSRSLSIMEGILEHLEALARFRSLEDE